MTRPFGGIFPHLKTSAGAYAANDTEAELSLDQAPLPADDALMLEWMLHHGADPEEVDRRVLDVLLKQCCGDCQIRFRRSRSSSTAISHRAWSIENHASILIAHIGELKHIRP